MKHPRPQLMGHVRAPSGVGWKPMTNPATIHSPATERVVLGSVILANDPGVRASIFGSGRWGTCFSVTITKSLKFNA